MYSTAVYYYFQRQLVVLYQSNSIRRYKKVYSKELNINRGVDNLIQFQFLNQEEKPVDISGKTITCRIINYNGREILLQKSLVPLLPVTGITSLQLSIADIESITSQKCYYSLEIPVSSFNYPVFVDANGGARGVINIVNSVLPGFVQSQDITIPTHPRPKSGLSRTYYSSIIFTNESPVLTTQRWLENFTGTLQFQGSTIEDFSTFYSIGPVFSYNEWSGTEGYTIEGYHPFIRMKIINDGSPPSSSNGDLSGDIVKLLAR